MFFNACVMRYWVCQQYGIVCSASHCVAFHSFEIVVMTGIIIHVVDVDWNDNMWELHWRWKEQTLEFMQFTILYRVLYHITFHIWFRKHVSFWWGFMNDGFLCCFWGVIVIAWLFSQYGTFLFPSSQLMDLYPPSY